MNTTVLLTKFEGLPASAQTIIVEFIDFIAMKYNRSLKTKTPKTGKQQFNFSWEGALSDFKDKFTSVELQHKANEWRSI